MTTTNTAVYEAINKIQAALSKSGIAKDRQGSQFKFRGIDDVYAALAPLLAEHKLCIIPRVISREAVERKSKSGGPLYFVSLKVEYDFVSAKDGSCHTAAAPGEAMDSSDKATNKAMSAAYKYLCLQTFCIPTEGDNDADGTTHEVAPAEPITLEFLVDKIIKAKAVTHLSNIWTKYADAIKNLPPDDLELLKHTKDKRKDELAAAAAEKKGGK